MFDQILNSEGFSLYIIPISLIVGSLAIGILIEKIVISRLKKLTEKTTWEGDDVIVMAIDKIIIVWVVIAGFYAAVLEAPIPGANLEPVLKILLIGFVLSIAVFLSKLFVGFVKVYQHKSEGALPATSIFANLIRSLVYLLAFLVILQSFGVSITPLLTALGVGGLAVALALQETLSNLFAGIQLIASKKFILGDYIELDQSLNGYIQDISWRNTTIRTLGNNLIIIPNSKIAQATVTNYSRPEKEMSVLVDIGVAYGSDLEKVERVTIEVANQVLDNVEGGKADFDPFLRFHTFADSSVNFTVILRVLEYVNQYLVKHEFVKALHKRFHEEGIAIPFPQRTVHMKKEE